MTLLMYDDIRNMPMNCRIILLHFYQYGMADDIGKLVRALWDIDLKKHDVVTVPNGSLDAQAKS